MADVCADLAVQADRVELQAQLKAEKELHKQETKELKYKKGLAKVTEKYNKQVAALQKAKQKMLVRLHPVPVEILVVFVGH